MKDIFLVNESEKERILGMHKSATKNQYLGEQATPPGDKKFMFDAAIQQINSRIPLPMTEAQNLYTMFKDTNNNYQTFVSKQGALYNQIMASLKSFHPAGYKLLTESQHMRYTPFTDSSSKPMTFNSSMMAVCLDIMHVHGGLVYLAAEKWNSQNPENKKLVTIPTWLKPTNMMQYFKNTQIVKDCGLA